MNHRDRRTLQELLEKLWRSRQGIRGTETHRSGYMTGNQCELIAAAMRIVAGSTNGPNLPPPVAGVDYQLTDQRPIEAPHAPDTAATAGPDNPAVGRGTADPGLPLANPGRWPTREPARDSPECTICSTYHAEPGWRHRLIQWLSNRR
jgi:hypothetical protein